MLQDIKYNKPLLAKSFNVQTTVNMQMVLLVMAEMWVTPLKIPLHRQVNNVLGLNNHLETTCCHEEDRAVAQAELPGQRLRFPLDYRSQTGPL